MALPVVVSSDGKTVDFGTPTPLFSTAPFSTAANMFKPQYVVSPDGQSFVMQSMVGESNSSPITVILNRK
jgi:hypothetical protein